MFDFIKSFISFLPLRINSVVWNGDFLVISGKNWSFTASGAWRVSRDKELLFACWDDDAGYLIKDVLDLTVVNLSWITNEQPIDPSILLSDGRRLDVFCASSYEPWIINLPDGCIYVGNS